MGFRFRRRVKLSDDADMNISKSGVGFSFGRRGLRFSINPRGKRSVNFGIPGTGLSYRTGCLLPIVMLLLCLFVAQRSMP